MKHVNKTVLLWYSPQEMFDLVADVIQYPQFLPWCQSVDIVAREQQGVVARLHLAYAGVRHAFTTRNEYGLNGIDQSLTVSLVDGPFSTLSGYWRFHSIQASNSFIDRACKIEFDLRYKFSHRALELLGSPVFDRVANTMVESFVKRAQEVYGQR